MGPDGRRAETSTGAGPTCGCARPDEGVRGGRADAAARALGRATAALAAGVLAVALLACDAGPGPGASWRPAPGTTWQWQLTGAIDTSFDVEMYDLDLFDAPDDVLATLRADRRIVVCYFSAGTWEDFREDRDAFPAAAIGLVDEAWPDESWLDVRHPGIRAPLEARLDLAVARGCDGVEPDNLDGFQNATGFPLSASDQRAFNLWLADAAHRRGLSIGLKNDLVQIPELVDAFDWALNEECVAHDECDAMAPFIAAGKAVFHAEYGDPARLDEVCAVTGPLGLSSLIKNLDLDAARAACP